MRMLFSCRSVVFDDIIITFNPKRPETCFSGIVVSVKMMSTRDRRENVVIVLFS